MKKWWVVSGFIVIGCVAGQVKGWAQDAELTDTTGTVASASETAATEAAGTDWKQEIFSDRQALREQREALKASGEAARAEEEQLRAQVKQAEESGDVETAKSLREQLKAMHEANVAARDQEIAALQGARQELKETVGEAREEGYKPPLRKDGQNAALVDRPWEKAADANKDGKVDRKEFGQWDRQKGNPPGPLGGPGRDKPLPAGLADRREDIRDRKEDIRDRREDILDRKEDIWDRQHDGGLKDKREDIRDRREDIRDRREDVRDKREDIRDHGSRPEKGMRGGQGMRNPPGPAGGPGRGTKGGSPQPAGGGGGKPRPGGGRR